MIEKMSINGHLLSAHLLGAAVTMMITNQPSRPILKEETMSGLIRDTP